MAAEQHYDFVFVFTRLRMERAFLYVATPTIVSACHDTILFDVENLTLCILVRNAWY